MKNWTITYLSEEEAKKYKAIMKMRYAGLDMVTLNSMAVFEEDASKQATAEENLKAQVESAGGEWIDWNTIKLDIPDYFIVRDIFIQELKKESENNGKFEFEVWLDPITMPLSKGLLFTKNNRKVSVYKFKQWTTLLDLNDYENLNDIIKSMQDAITDEVNKEIKTIKDDYAKKNPDDTLQDSDLILLLKDKIDDFIKNYKDFTGKYDGFLSDAEKNYLLCKGVKYEK